MKVITICGSLKFEEIIKNYTQKLELEGNCVLGIVYPTKEKNTYTDEELQTFGKCHFKKIDLSDAIFVVNKDGYIGESVKKEIKYAKEQNKEIMYLEEPIKTDDDEGIKKIVYNKLVRDKIVEIIENEGGTATYNILNTNEFIEGLNKKLIEETKEFIEENDIEKLADIYEVLNKIIELRNINIKEVEKIMEKKAEEKGKFEHKVYLKDVIKKIGKGQNCT
jgi:predicted house-cleaning noncanonical NTP pyrophosphatase (MazG superfamily)